MVEIVQSVKEWGEAAVDAEVYVSANIICMLIGAG